MLKSLYIKNFVLIDSLDIQLDAGFSVITGETGAGKSIILGALSLVLGQRADGKRRKHAATAGSKRRYAPTLQGAGSQMQHLFSLSGTENNEPV